MDSSNFFRLLSFSLGTFSPLWMISFVNFSFQFVLTVTGQLFSFCTVINIIVLFSMLEHIMFAVYDFTMTMPKSERDYFFTFTFLK